MEWWNLNGNGINQFHSLMKTASLSLEKDFGITSYQELEIRQLRKWLKQHCDSNPPLFSICWINYGCDEEETQSWWSTTNNEFQLKSVNRFGRLQRGKQQPEGFWVLFFKSFNVNFMQKDWDLMMFASCIIRICDIIITTSTQFFGGKKQIKPNCFRSQKA